MAFNDDMTASLDAAEAEFAETSRAMDQSSLMGLAPTVTMEDITDAARAYLAGLGKGGTSLAPALAVRYWVEFLQHAVEALGPDRQVPARIPETDKQTFEEWWNGSGYALPATREVCWHAWQAAGGLP